MTNSISENNKRIAKNTLLLYVRMLFNMLVALYTSRVILNALGVEDFGISNVVGGLVAMFSLISSSLSSSVSRFLTFELGRGNHEKLRNIFSTSVIIHLGLSFIVLILMETIGLWFLNTHMTISPERIEAANWVFHGSVLTFILGLISVPYNATIISHEHMGVYAYIGILQTILRLFIALFLAYGAGKFDKLILYSILTVAVSIICQIIYWLYCKNHFSESQIKWSIDKSTIKEMTSFAGWNFIGCTAGLLKDQGVNILLNLFFNPAINAARGIAYTVNSAIGGFAGNFMTALNPQITKSYAAGNTEYTFSLVERGSRFSYYILLIFIIPIFLESEFILTLWLKQFPDHTLNFVHLVLILMLIEILSNTLITLQTATGKIRDYQLAVGGMLLMNFPLSWFCLKVGCPPESTMLVAIIVGIFCLVLRLIFLQKMTGLSMYHYMQHVCLNVLFVTCMSSIIPCAIIYFLEDNCTRAILTIVFSFISSICCIYYIGCDKTEREFIQAQIEKLYKRIKP